MKMMAGCILLIALGVAYGEEWIQSLTPLQVEGLGVTIETSAWLSHCSSLAAGSVFIYIPTNAKEGIIESGIFNGVAFYVFTYSAKNGVAVDSYRGFINVMALEYVCRELTKDPAPEDAGAALAFVKKHLVGFEYPINLKKLVDISKPGIEFIPRAAREYELRSRRLKEAGQE